ncbi:Ubiquitin-conjugating enzyme E2 35 [Hypoxylon texense]
MPATFDHLSDPAKKGKTIKSAYDSETFDADVTIHVDGLVGSATISPSGRDVALASPEGLAVIDLDSPYSPPRRLSSHGLPWLVVDVQWSPFAARDYWVASTANHRCLVWNLNLREDSPTGAIEHSLQGHSRAITDINFSAHHPDLLATCAVDGYVHCWDLRRPKQPALTFCDWFAGATQVKYNRQDPNVLASSHDRWLHIWDERKPSTPLKSIIAHTSKIYGLDWNRTKSTSLITCSLDKSIKFWDYAESSEPERIIRTDFPVWRARHTPFGWGLLAMPQNDPGNLYLYDVRRAEGEGFDEIIDPRNIFPGHGNHKVKEFLWRSRGAISDEGMDNREFQLVSWGEDNELRLQRVDQETLASVGHIKGGPARNINLTRKGAAYKTYRAVDDQANKEKKSATMTDPRPGSGGSPPRRSALTMGMQTMSSHYHRTSSGLASWKGPSMKAKSATGKTTDRSLDQLGWMKGITMSKKSGLIGTPQRKESKDSTMFGHNFHDAHWGEPETLQEEIIRVNRQLPNVTWDHVDMESLTLKASLKGPWGADGDTIYIKVKVDIPRSYPKSKAPKFIVEKTALMADQTHKKLDQEIHQLVSQCAKKKQNCLEMAFSYLLGEIDLSSSDSLFKNVKDLDDDLGGLADESSSEEDDSDIPAGGSATMSQELTASTELDATLAPTNRPTIPPMPRLCGCRFSNDGRLVCFFPTKEEKARAASFFPTSDSIRERPRGEPSFAGFGRLQQESSAPRNRYTDDGVSATDDQSDSDDGEESSSSSDSETTYMHKITMWYLPGRRFRKTFSGSYSMHSSGGGTGIGTGTGTGTSRRRPAKPKNIISIHNVANELPSKQEFAREYSIFGDGPDVCEHNAAVAQKYGRPDLVDVWKYAALLLRKDIPLELLGNGQNKESILVIARNAVARFGEDRPSSSGSSKALTGRVKWGLHPLAKDLINDLLEYFERVADVQMLAMLSCIFSESSTEDSVAYAESRLTQPETPLPMKAPSFSLDYFATDASLWHPGYGNHKSQANSAISTPKTMHTPVNLVGSYGSEEVMWGGDPKSNSYSCGETPPTTTTPREPDSEITQSLAASPDNRLLTRANTALSAGLASFPRAFASVASTSPPGRKRPSPGETFLANLAPGNITWGSSTILGSTSEPAGTARNSYSDDDNVRNDDSLPLVCYGISTTMEDQTKFDDDGWLGVPFLDPSRHAIYANYRHAYAEMLQTWGQPLARLEILKFNVFKEDTSDPQAATSFASSGAASYHDSYHSTENLSQGSRSHHGANSPIVLGKKELLQSLITSDRGIDVTGICRIHEIHLDPVRQTHANSTFGGAIGTCDRCKRTQMQLLCVFCNEPIDALYPPCLSCGCASHDACIAEWHAAGETECPAGDECNCVEEASSGEVESWAVMMGAISQGKIRKPSDVTMEDAVKTAIDKRGSIDKYDWEKVAGGAYIPHSDGQGKPLDQQASGGPMLSAARISLGNKLRKSAGNWGSTTTLRKKSGGGAGSASRR